MVARILFAALVAAISIFSLSPAALAQSTERDAAIAACSSSSATSAACTAAIQRYIATLDGLPPKQMNDALADLVVELSASAGPETRAIIGNAIVAVASAMTDQTRADAAIEVAQNVSDGVPVDGATVSALASPS